MATSGSSSVIKYAKNPRKPFIFFSNEHKKTIRNATGLGKGREGRDLLDSKVSEAWRHLPKEHRAKYEAAWRADKLRFEREVASGLPVKKAPSSRRRRAVSSVTPAPKKPQSPFLLFCCERRKAIFDEASAAGEELQLGDIAKRLGSEWNRLSEEERQPYVDHYNAASEQYSKDVDAYLAQEQAPAAPKASPKAPRDPNLPKKFVSAYMRFQIANRQRVKANSGVKLSGAKLSKVLAEEWKALTAEQKQPFQEAAASDIARYSAEMKAYRLKNPTPVMKRNAKAKKRGSTKAKPTVKKQTKSATA